MVDQGGAIFAKRDGTKGQDFLLGEPFLSYFAVCQTGDPSTTTNDLTYGVLISFSPVVFPPVKSHRLVVIWFSCFVPPGFRGREEGYYRALSCFIGRVALDLGSVRLSTSTFMLRNGSS